MFTTGPENGFKHYYYYFFFHKDFGVHKSAFSQIPSSGSDLKSLDVCTVHGYLCAVESCDCLWCVCVCVLAT